MDAELQALVDELKAKSLENLKSEANVIVELMPKALALAAKQSATPIDDVAVAALAPVLVSVLKDLIGKIK